jgi:hypothetical protein
MDSLIWKGIPPPDELWGGPMIYNRNGEVLEPLRGGEHCSSDW